jgi:acetyltransferase-like isoleucine patch superfamily enzyme
MSTLQAIVERIVGRIKGDPAYHIAGSYTNRQLATVLWHRGMQISRGVVLATRARGVQRPVFRGRRVVVEHGYALTSGPGLILEDGVAINALSRDGIGLGRNVTIGRFAVLTCTGVLANIGVGIRIGDRSAIGAASFVGGQGGVSIGDDVIIGPGVRIFSENHNYDALDLPIRAQGETRIGVTVADDCWIGANALILDGVSIGTGCVIAAGAVVTTSIPPYTVAAGVPARSIRSRRPDEKAPVPPPEKSPPARDPLARPTAHALREDR